MKKEKTTIRVQKTTIEQLRVIAQRRGRCESMDQIILELVDNYVRAQNA